MIKQLLNSVIKAIIDLLVTDESRYFAQPRPIVVNYLQQPHLDGITHAQSIIGRQLFAGHMLALCQLKERKNARNDN